MDRKRLLVAMMTLFLMGALWLALAPAAHAQCGPGGTFPCPPPEREKKPTATDRPVTPTSTPTQTPRPTPTWTATPTVPLAVPPAPGPLGPRRWPSALTFIPGSPGLLGGILLVLLLLGYITIVRFRRNAEGGSTKPQLDLTNPVDDATPDKPNPGAARHDRLIFSPTMNEVDYMHSSPGLVQPPEPDVPGLQSPPDPDVPGMNNPPDPDVPTGLGGPDT